jgi:hypothetical protein
MAEVQDVSLEMGRVSGQQQLEFATVDFRVRFSPGEVALNLDYEIHIAIVEQDEQIDTYFLIPNGFAAAGTVISHSRPEFLRQQRRGNRDEFIYYRKADPLRPAGFTIRPDGDAERSMSIRMEFDVGDQERGEDEYRALVWVVPEVSTGHNMSDIVRVNLG